MSTNSLLIANISRHIPVKQHEAQIILNSFQEKQYKKGESILAINEVCRYDYFVVKGCLRSFYIDQTQSERTIHFSMPGWWTGNLKSFATGSPSDFGIEALTDAEVLRITRSKLDNLFEKVPSLNKFFRIILQNNLIATEDRVANHISAPAQIRYEEFHKKFPTLEQTVPLKYIASYLGITNAYLSRLRSRKKGKRN